MQKVKILEYEIEEELHSSRKGKIFRAIQKNNKNKVILKTLQDYPSARDKARLKKEYEILQSIHSLGIVEVLAFETDNDSPILVMNDSGGISLNKLLKEKSYSLQEKLQIAIKLSEAIENIHQHEIIHLDIKPSNIIYNPKSKQLTIIDFGISTRLSRENPSITSPDNLEGTLAYLSPEQTGRMNRSIDYRADFYSLGITLYELFTGVLPFYSKDSMEMVHFHIAVEEERVHNKNPKVPTNISHIIHKLMNKRAEDRYQGGYGIRHDLQLCLDLLQTGKLETEQIELATRDVSEKFQIPQKLYGREKEIAKLLFSFDRIANGSSELMIVKGYSGIGKSALVNEIHKPIVEKRGYFIGGKFDQFKRDIPYSAIILAFQDLVRQLLTEPEEKISHWKERILKAVGNNGQVIIDIIPEIEYIIHKQPLLPELGSIESINRFNRVFKEFVKAFTAKEHPLVLFIDDMQWADSASLKFIENILSDREIEYLLFISSYRDNEVDATHPFISTLEFIKASGCAIETIRLSTLSLTDINLMISESIQVESHSTLSLSSVVLRKTNGNPFFASEFLKSLYQERLLNFNSIEGFWQWDKSKIENSGITDNVVELMSGKIQKLSEKSKKLLELASCIGNRFDLKTLSIVNEKTEIQTALELEGALKEGIIQAIGDAYKYITEVDYEKIIYRFLHDRVQQAAYTLIPEKEKKQVHLTIGKHLLKNTQEEEIDEFIFDIVNHINIGKEFILEDKEILYLAKLNFKAGQKAKSSNAYTSALAYLQLAFNYTNNLKSWTENYQLTFDICLSLVEVEYLNGNFDKSEKLFETFISKARTNIDKGKVYEIKVIQLTNQGKLAEAVEAGRECLKLFNISLPKNPSYIRVLLKEVIQSRLIRGMKKIESLNEIKYVPNPEVEFVINMLNHLCSPSYGTDQNLFAIIVCLGVILSIKNNNNKHSSYLYSLYAALNGSELGFYKDGQEFGHLADRINKKFEDKRSLPRVKFSLGAFVYGWKDSLELCQKELLLSFESGIDVGDIIYSCYAAAELSYKKIFTGKNIEEIINYVKKYHQYIIKSQDKWMIPLTTALYQSLLNLKSETKSLLSFDTINFNEEGFENHILREDTMNWYWTRKMVITYLYDEYETAFEFGIKAENTIQYSFALIIWVEQSFFLSLSSLAILIEGQNNSLASRQYKRNMQKLKRWAQNNPKEYDNKYLILLGENCRYRKKFKSAIKFFEKAILKSINANYLLDAAIANELVAKIYKSLNKIEISKLYLLNARYLYHKWGAKAKVK
ncbi:MAG: serine/threonine-protein kinase PknK, partial [Spirochaetota bacterium]